MSCAKLRIALVAPALMLGPISGVWAEQKSALMRTGELACNDWCKSWMALGEKHDTSQAVARLDPQPASALAGSAAIPSTGWTRPRSGAVTADHHEPRPTVKLAQQAQRARVAAALLPRPAIAILPPLARDRQANTIASLAASGPVGQVETVTSGPSVLERLASRHRSPLPVASEIAPEEAMPGPVVATRTDDPSTRLLSVNWVTGAQRSDRAISESEAETITCAIAGGLLLTMAGLPLTTTPRRKGNRTLEAAVRASRRERAEAGDSDQPAATVGTRRALGAGPARPVAWLRRLALGRINAGQAHDLVVGPA